jgi:glucokinase
MVTQHCTIGVDIGGTNIRAARISPSGAILQKRIVAGSRDRETAIGLITDLIREMDDPDTIAIGVGVPGRVDATRARCCPAAISTCPAATSNRDSNRPSASR